MLTHSAGTVLQCADCYLGIFTWRSANGSWSDQLVCNWMAPANNHVTAISTEIFKYVRIHPDFASRPVWFEKMFLCFFPLKAGRKDTHHQKGQVFHEFLPRIIGCPTLHLYLIYDCVLWNLQGKIYVCGFTAYTSVTLYISPYNQVSIFICFSWRNALFFYTSGVTVGVLGCLLIIVFILYRMIPNVSPSRPGCLRSMPYKL